MQRNDLSGLNTFLKFSNRILSIQLNFNLPLFHTHGSNKTYHTCKHLQVLQCENLMDGTDKNHQRMTGLDKKLSCRIATSHGVLKIRILWCENNLTISDVFLSYSQMYFCYSRITQVWHRNGIRAYGIQDAHSTERYIFMIWYTKGIP